jgi:hypothetical protein
MATLDVGQMLPTKFQPKLSNQFLLNIEGIDNFLVKSCSRPNQTVEPIELPWMNSTRKIAGKTKWEDMSVALHDSIAPSTMQQVLAWHRLQHESISGRNGYPDFYKRDIQLLEIDPVGNVIGQWDIKGAFITGMAGGEYAYENSTPVEVTLTIAFDNAVKQF